MSPPPADGRPQGEAERILIVEDVEADFRLLQRHLQRQGLGGGCRQVCSLAEIEQALRDGGWQVVLVDHQVPGVTFDALLLRLRRELPEVPVILVSGTIGEELAVDLLHQGVSDFVFKDRLARLVPAIERCLDDVRRRREAVLAARALADSEAFSRTMLGSLVDGLFVAQDRRFVFANPALPAMLGHSVANFAGSRFEDVVAPESLALWDERFAQRVRPEAPEPERQYDVAFMHRDGHYLWLELRATRFDYHGRPAVLGLLRDTTERRRIVAELEQHRHHLEALVEERTHKAESAYRAKSAFLANMSHEIRTPLNAISGMVHILQRGALDDGQRNNLLIIDRAAQHLLSLVNDVLDLSKVESGKLTLEAIDFDLDALLEHALGLVAERAREKGLCLALDNQAAGQHLRGDPTRLTQLLLNLLGNAVKFTDSGEVRLRCGIDLAEPDRPILTLEVSDTGIGIGADRLAQLFSPFEQADSSTTRRYGGTGLGLAICRHLAELMDGTISVHSQSGQGSRFVAQLRLHAAGAALPLTPGSTALAPDMAALEQALRSRHGGTRVLVAEDNEVNQLVAREVLLAAGLLVDVADNGQQAVELAQRESYAAILMDVQMPVLDGLQATRMLRRLPATAGVPVIAMTANAFGEDRAACLAAGMDDHLAKPVAVDRLYALLLRWLPDAARAALPRPAAAPAEAVPSGRSAGVAPAGLPVGLAHVAGLQADAGLAQFGHSASFYRRGLQQFVEQYGAGLSGLGQASPERPPGPRPVLCARLRALQAAAATLGANALAAQALSLESRLQSALGVDADEERQLALRVATLQADLRQLTQALAECLDRWPGTMP
ncbi:response regulator [Aquabacterium sp. OR-4]|uniref:response regulator n=1 Tax=Aquabacterium sp. OR-4 TaxID=2978127 RepID=UPI0028C6D6EC|nr:response regulator [Aquabacterium sp. OR-4]MDT7838863.1 response regulator [Aquabacterium sp. OR-4]